MVVDRWSVSATNRLVGSEESDVNYRRRVMIALISLALAMGAMGCDEESESDADEEVVATEEDEAGAEADEGEGDDEDEEEDEESADAEEDADEEDEGDEGEEKEGEEDEEDGEDEESADAEGDEEDDDEEEDDDDLAGESDPSDLPIYATSTVATIDGETITADDFNAIAEMQLGGLPREAIEAQRAQLPQMKEMLIEGLVAAHLIDREIERQGIVIDDDEVDEALDEYLDMLSQQMGGDRQAFEASLEAQGIDQEVIREQAAQEMAAERLLAERGGGGVSEADARAYFDANPEQFQQEHATRVRHILLNVDDFEEGESDEDEVRQTIEGLRSEVVEDGDRFAALATEHSDCPSSAQGGELGYVTRDQLMPEFTEVAFELEVGAISEPVRTNLGWHIIRAEDRVEEQQVSFEEVKDQLMMMLEAQGMEQTAMDLIEELREAADVQIHEGAVHISG